jgi:pimeloyl-ACP methyl ester carboxylesterase
MDSVDTPNDSPWQNFRLPGVDGVVIAGEIGGDPAAPTIVLMHGGGQTRHSWASTMRVLIDSGYRVISYDLRGHGDSGWSADGVYSTPLFVADLRIVLRLIDGPFALIGASMGGVTALAAVSEGLRPAALVLVDIVLRPERAGVDRIRSFMASNPDGFASLDEAVAAVAAYNPHRAKSAEPRGLMRNLRLGADGRLHWHWDPRLFQRDITKELIAREKIADRLSAASNVPMLLIRGGHSDVLSDANVADFRRYVPGVEVYDVAGAGHMLVGDSNETFMRGVAEYLKRHLG